MIEYVKRFTYADLKRPKTTTDQIFELDYEELDDYVKLLKSQGVSKSEIRRKLEKLKSDSILTYAGAYATFVGSLGAIIPAILLKNKSSKLAIMTGILGGGAGMYGGWKLGTKLSNKNTQVIDSIIKNNNLR